MFIILQESIYVNTKVFKHETTVYEDNNVGRDITLKHKSLRTTSHYKNSALIDKNKDITFQLAHYFTMRANLTAWSLR